MNSGHALEPSLDGGRTVRDIRHWDALLNAISRKDFVIKVEDTHGDGFYEDVSSRGRQQGQSGVAVECGMSYD